MAAVYPLRVRMLVRCGFVEGEAKARVSTDGTVRPINAVRTTSATAFDYIYRYAIAAATSSLGLMMKRMALTERTEGREMQHPPHHVG